jgi:hypothetical protein
MPRPLTLRRVFVDQSLVARIFAEWVPGWIELEHRDGERSMRTGEFQLRIRK